MPIGTIKSRNDVTRAYVPHSDALIKRSSCDILSFGRNRYCCDAILDLEVQNLSILLNIPDANSVITTARSDMSTIAGKIEGVDVLVMSGKGVPN